MRNLKRPNAKIPAYRQLEEKKFEVFVPFKWVIKIKDGRQTKIKEPYMRDLVFVRGKASEIEKIVEKSPLLQFRYERGGYRKPMIIRDEEMRRFIDAVNVSENPRYYLPEELTPEMYGRKIRILGGNLEGYEGILLKIRGSKTKRVLIELPNFFSIAVEFNSEYVELL